MCTWNACKDLNLTVICSFMELLHGSLFRDSENQTSGDGPNYLEEKQVLTHSKESLQACQKQSKCTLLPCIIWKVNMYLKLNRSSVIMRLNSKKKVCRRHVQAQGMFFPWCVRLCKMNPTPPFFFFLYQTPFFFSKYWHPDPISH